MAVVRKTGAVIERVLPGDENKPAEEQTILVIKVLGYDEWRKMLGALGRLMATSNAGEVLEGARKVMGAGLIDVKNLQVLGEGGETEDFILKKIGDEITKESMGILMPFRDHILDAIREASQFGVTDAKN